MKDFKEFLMENFDDFAESGKQYSLDEVIELMEKAWDAKPVLEVDDLEPKPKPQPVYVQMEKHSFDRFMKQLDADSNALERNTEYMQRVGAMMQQMDDRLALMAELLKYKNGTNI